MAHPPGYSGVVTAQPVVHTQMQQQTTVVIQQPTAALPNPEWSSGTFGCFEDMKSCCCVLCLGNVYYGGIAVRMGESYIVGCSGYPQGCVPGGHLAMRAAFRNKHGIPGTILGDFCQLAFCLPCAMCQLSREMDHRGYPSGGCC